jgi:hypothetical protein
MEKRPLQMTIPHPQCITLNPKARKLANYCESLEKLFLKFHDNKLMTRQFAISYYYRL